MRKTHLVALIIVGGLAATRAQATRFDVRAYGAKGDGRTVDTAAINQARRSSSGEATGRARLENRRLASSGA
jgi:hypothetical protein